MASDVQEELEVECLKNGYQLNIQVQPPQNPDLDILDLRLFHNLQRRVVDLKEGAGLEAIVDAITNAFESYYPAVLEIVWRALFSVQSDVLEQQGGNGFGIPHEDGRNAVMTETMAEEHYVTAD